MIVIKERCIKLADSIERKTNSIVDIQLHQKINAIRKNTLLKEREVDIDELIELIKSGAMTNRIRLPALVEERLKRIKGK